MTQTNHFDVIVIGVGAMGASACWHLARRGVRVLGLDAFDIPNTRGSSHGFSRMIRMAYYAHADYVPLLRRAYELWDELERDSGSGDDSGDVGDSGSGSGSGGARLLQITGGL